MRFALRLPRLLALVEPDSFGVLLGVAGFSSGGGAGAGSGSGGGAAGSSFFLVFFFFSLSACYSLITACNVQARIIRSHVLSNQ